MKFNSLIVSSASGSIGGCTYSRNHSGQYIRRRAMPVNPGSAFAGIMTALFASLVTRWTTILTPAQRAGWDVWALNTPQADSLGNAILWTGQNAYISMNAFRLQIGLTYVDDAPAIYNGATYTPATGVILTNVSEATQDFDFEFDNTDTWANEVGGALAVYVSRPQNPSINYFKGPYRFSQAVAGAVVPPTSPFTIAAQFAITEGQQIFVQARVCNADGRISSVRRFSALVGP